MVLQLSILSDRVLLTGRYQDEDGTVYHHRDHCMKGQVRYGLTFEQMASLGPGPRDTAELRRIGQELNGKVASTPQE